MKDIFVIGAKLAVICAISALALALVNSITEPLIVQRKADELSAKLNALVPEAVLGAAEIVTDFPGVTERYPLTKDGKKYGFILNLVGTGYAGEMKILAAFSREGEVRNVVLAENDETPGLGKKAESPAYMTKYIGSGLDKPVPVRKNQLNQVDADAVTGATITFAGIGRALEKGADYTRQMRNK